MSTVNNQQVSIGKLLLFFKGLMYELVISNEISLLYQTDTKKLELCKLHDDLHYDLIQHSNDNLYNIY